MWTRQRQCSNYNECVLTRVYIVMLIFPLKYFLTLVFLSQDIRFSHLTTVTTQLPLSCECLTFPATLCPYASMQAQLQLHDFNKTPNQHKIRNMWWTVTGASQFYHNQLTALSQHCLNENILLSYFFFPTANFAIFMLQYGGIFIAAQCESSIKRRHLWDSLFYCIYNIDHVDCISPDCHKTDKFYRVTK